MISTAAAAAHLWLLCVCLRVMRSAGVHTTTTEDRQRTEDRQSSNRDGQRGRVQHSRLTQHSTVTGGEEKCTDTTHQGHVHNNATDTEQSAYMRVRERWVGRAESRRPVAAFSSSLVNPINYCDSRVRLFGNVHCCRLDWIDLVSHYRTCHRSYCPSACLLPVVPLRVRSVGVCQCWARLSQLSLCCCWLSQCGSLTKPQCLSTGPGNLLLSLQPKPSHFYPSPSQTMLANMPYTKLDTFFTQLPHIQAQVDRSSIVHLLPPSSLSVDRWRLSTHSFRLRQYPSVGVNELA